MTGKKYVAEMVYISDIDACLLMLIERRLLSVLSYCQHGQKLIKKLHTQSMRKSLDNAQIWIDFASMNLKNKEGLN